mmetsp:Transcript_22455/g.53224  ORF Transcript_22455/g.53224 Transcript_22455/m.53224 type:complete len:358 (+) Transcript_22455:531-1604(+)
MKEDFGDRYIFRWMSAAKILEEKVEACDFVSAARRTVSSGAIATPDTQVGSSGSGSICSDCIRAPRTGLVLCSSGWRVRPLERGSVDLYNRMSIHTSGRFCGDALGGEHALAVGLSGGGGLGFPLLLEDTALVVHGAETRSAVHGLGVVRADLGHVVNVGGEVLFVDHGKPVLGHALHGSHEGCKADRRRLERCEVVINDGKLSQELGHLHHVVPYRRLACRRLQQQHVMPGESKRRRRVDLPSQFVEDRPLHGSNVLLGEVSPAQLDERGHAQLVGVVELAGQVKRRHRNKLKGPFIDRTLAEVAVQIREGYGDDLPVVVKVVDDLVGPLADFGPPVLVDAGGGGVGSDGVGRRCG